MPRAGLSPAAVVGAALELVDAAGPAALTLAAVAGRVGVATPSLYKHVASLTDLRRLLAVRVFDELTEVCTSAVLGRSSDDAISSLMAAYHAYAVGHPHRYALIPQAPDPDLTVSAAGDRLVAVCFAALKGYSFDDDQLVHATRVLRSTLHGFAVLCTSGGFGLPQDLTVTSRWLSGTVIAGLRSFTPALPS